MADWVETGRPVAHPWFCDTMGHLNVRHYSAMFDDAAFQFLGMLAPPGWLAASGLGWADVKLTIEFVQEVQAGTCLVVRSRLVRIGGKSFTYRHEMRDAETGAIHATCGTVTVLFDLKQRKAVPIEGDLRERAALMIEVPL
ncbi:MAG TPA: thioesterase family protein [Geminicoccus sp.]|jgi:acyl-CoA thioester hydrolase|uniref:acyl-CoA thioesterase n=1 Tax=Geminicoccus sp. TaxID=2024832 RepID=UPI002E35A516|nr:thioesterase family protein [Geminicoccus sp.]HEX2529142.1 thioesterase family protein [Geminicoccus sp.]